MKAKKSKFKKFVKKNLSQLYTIIITVIITSTISVTAASVMIDSAAIRYNDNGNVSNVQDALNTLYSSVEVTTITPVGAILPYMGKTAPTNYLICDGSTYNINDYKKLADHIKNNFGSYNYFGGDGTTTFAVPDLRGEFLRGAGDNTHTQTIAGVKVYEGGGGSVGTHQGGTVMRNLWHYDNSSNNQSIWYSNSSSGINSNSGMANADRWMVASTHSRSVVDSTSVSSNTTNYVGFSTRPTNTSVNYIIKTK